MTTIMNTGPGFWVGSYIRWGDRCREAEETIERLASEPSRSKRRRARQLADVRRRLGEAASLQAAAINYLMSELAARRLLA